ncbi:MAG: hypothetical protein GXO96_11630 [Nitrospirae bacterium]|nr:hypothetical protein [Candidatus Manganitrophaceae bacterium]
MFDKFSPKTKKVVLIIGVVLPLFFTQAYLQQPLNAYKVNQREDFLYLPSGDYLKPLALGYNQVVADLLWIKTVHYFGSHFTTDKEYPWLHHILSIIIDLDPQFDFPYYFGGIVLSMEADQKDRANDILARGMEAYPEKWEYPFYIGFNHYYHDGNPAAALPFIEKAAALPKVPEFVKSLVGTLYLETGKKETALQFFRKIYENTSDDLVREKISMKVEKILSEEVNHDIRD